MQTAKDIMSKNMIGLLPGASLGEACSIMKKAGLRHLPVYDLEQKVIGILSDRDVKKALDAEGKKLHEEVRIHMSSPVLWVKAESTLMDVIKVLVEHKISAVMVRDQADYVGILTTEDLLNCMLEILEKSDELASKPLSFFLPNILF